MSSREVFFLPSARCQAGEYAKQSWVPDWAMHHSTPPCPGTRSTETVSLHSLICPEVDVAKVMCIRRETQPLKEFFET